MPTHPGGFVPGVAKVRLHPDECILKIRANNTAVCIRDHDCWRKKMTEDNDEAEGS
jgi:hypothetical protein